MWSHEAEVTIDAPPSEVWKVLVELDRYPQWNRYAISASGELRIGGEVEINVPRQGGKRGPVNNRVTELVINQRLCWRSLSWYRFLVYGVRCRHLDVQSDGAMVFREGGDDARTARWCCRTSNGAAAPGRNAGRMRLTQGRGGANSFERSSDVRAAT